MKDFNRYLPANLDITLGEHTYSIKPPTKKVGTQLAALLATSMNRLKGEQPSEQDRAALESIPDDLEVGRLSLGDAVYDQMLADEQPGAWMDRAATYALWYWVMGEAAADAMADRVLTGDRDDDEAGEAAPKASKGPKTGPRTASASPTSTASTRATGSRRAPSDRKPPATKPAASRGRGSSTTGD